jgi:outer membrane receptor protein involved in Fe transport
VNRKKWRCNIWTHGGYYSKANQGLYNHYFKYNPYGTPQVNLEEKLLYGKFKVVLNPRSYLSANISYYDRSFLSRVFDNAQYYEIRPQNGTAEFSTTGEDWVYFDTRFNRAEFSASYFTQLTKIHGLEVGVNYSELETKLARRNPDGFSALENYEYKPVEIQAYISDKMEFEDMGLIINFGVRMDYIDPKRKVLVDLRELTNLNAELTDAEPEIYFNPRLGISFPIMETAAVHFGFGRYYQYPDYFKVFQGTYLVEATQVYRPNPQLENTPIADTEIKPEKTVNYEVGIQTKLSPYVAFDITGFYRKTSNLIGVILNETNEGRRFQVMGNLDYATVKGIEFSIKKQFSNNFSASLNYTLSKALVSTSVLFERPLDEALTFPANWDQPHSLNANLFFEFRNGFGFSIYGSASSGFPYTRSQFDPNGERAPWISALDLNVFKNFNFFGISQQFYVQVLNVFNRKNVWWVYSDSGIPGDDASEATSHDYTNNPTMWGPGRTIQLGIKIWNP